MVKVLGVDHLSIRVSDFAASKAFYGQLFPFLSFEVLDEFEAAIGWTNGRTRFWIGQSEPGRRKTHHIGDVGFHHYAFELQSRAEVDELQAFVRDTLGRPSSTRPPSTTTTTTRSSSSTRTA